MAKTTSEETPVKVFKQCECGATVFQGPFQRGPIVDGEFQPRETLYQCVNCNRVTTLDQLGNHEVPRYGL